MPEITAEISRDAKRALDFAESKGIIESYGDFIEKALGYSVEGDGGVFTQGVGEDTPFRR